MVRAPDTRTKVIILAGGKGTRLVPYTTVFPKPLMPIDDHPILEIVIRQLASYGFNDITIAVGHLAELIEVFFGDGNKFGVKIEYSREDKPLGTAAPLSLIKNLPETFLVMNGDVLTTMDYRQLVQHHIENEGVVTIAMHKKEINIDLGVMEFDNDRVLTRYTEKPTMDYQVSMGIYVFNRDALKYFPEDTYFDFPDLIKVLLKNGEKVVCYPSDDYWLDIGRSEDYHEANEVFSKLKDQFLKEI
ncbi:MAG: NTP transferase domain-containing protein [Bacteroidetes bacterium]|nr:NTP transferase domain-containing protein [Bacteroidota bacterium]